MAGRSRASRCRVEEAAPPAAVYQLDRMLTLVTTRGTGREAAARLPRGTVVAGKTGTSSDTRDSWFAGFTGSYLSVVWVGYDDNRVTGLTAPPEHCRCGQTLSSASSPLPSSRFRPNWWRTVGSISATDWRRLLPAVPTQFWSRCRKDTVLPGKPAAIPRLPRRRVTKSRHGSRTSFTDAARRRAHRGRTAQRLLIAVAAYRSAARVVCEQSSTESAVPESGLAGCTVDAAGRARAAARVAADPRESPVARRSLAGDAGANPGVAR